MTDVSYAANKCIYIRNEEYLWDLAAVRSLMNLAKDSGEEGPSKFDISTDIHELHITYWHVSLG